MKTNMSIESNPKGLWLVLWEVRSDKTIRHKLSLEDIYSLLSFLTGRMYAMAKRAKR